MTQAPAEQQYPPPEHILRDLRLSVEHRPDGTSTAWIPVTPHVCNPSGSPRAGVLSILVDVVGGGLAAIAVRPDWIATADLTLHLIPSIVTGEIEARTGASSARVAPRSSSRSRSARARGRHWASRP